ncbi:hypothetical protein D5018_05430 [Parashewanella curva]|uniref:Uncharacterized protein n=1 Tax=Parashewanella curva TaxID=2338552 RepID=A0A3L8PZH7_9GAMM|nr:hypothetical protein [Parashewanella curva]RLV60715.1 hypothetical protein D5018_05430 [Parashewanella curva]
MPQENPQTKFLTIGYSDKRGGLGVDDRVPEFDIDARIFPICNVNVDTGEEMVRIVQVEVCSHKRNYGLDVRVKDLTDYVSTAEELDAVSVSEQLLEEYIKDKYLALLGQN